MIKEKKEESMLMQRQQLEEVWLRKTVELKRDREPISAPASVRPQSVKLEKYMIMPFKGDYKDWICFWNQYSVEVDGSAISIEDILEDKRGDIQRRYTLTTAYRGRIP